MTTHLTREDFNRYAIETWADPLHQEFPKLTIRPVTHGEYHPLVTGVQISHTGYIGRHRNNLSRRVLVKNGALDMAAARRKAQEVEDFRLRVSAAAQEHTAGVEAAMEVEKSARRAMGLEEDDIRFRRLPDGTWGIRLANIDAEKAAAIARILLQGVVA